MRPCRREGERDRRPGACQITRMGGQSLSTIALRVLIARPYNSTRAAVRNPRKI